MSIGVNIDLLQDRHRLDRLGHSWRRWGGLSPVKMIVLMAVKVLSMSVVVPGQKE